MYSMTRRSRKSDVLPQAPPGFVISLSLHEDLIFSQWLVVNDLGVISLLSFCLNKVDANEYYCMPVATQTSTSSLSPSSSLTPIASSGLCFNVCSR
jgi:hypothetical protein